MRAMLARYKYRQIAHDLDILDGDVMMPSASAQAKLIRKTYAHTDLDAGYPNEQPQFF